MRVAALFLAWLAAASAAGTGGEAPQSACKPGGFTLIRFNSGTEAQGKTDANFRVFLESSNYQGNEIGRAHV